MMGVKNKIWKFQFGFFLSVFFLSFLVSGSVALAKYEISDGSIKALYHQDNNFIDSSGNGNNGNDANITYATAFIGNGGSYNGSSGYVYVASSSSLNITGGNISVFMWIKPNSVSGYQRLVNKWNTTYGYSWNFYLNGDKMEWAESNGSIKSRTATNCSLATTTYQFIGFVKSGTSFSFYRNGVACSDTGTGLNSTINSSNSQLYVGALNDGGLSQYFNGILDELFIASSSLSTTTISSLYNAGSGNELCTTSGCSTSTPVSTTTGICEYYDSVDTDVLTNYLGYFWKGLFALGVIMFFWKVTVIAYKSFGSKI